MNRIMTPSSLGYAAAYLTRVFFRYKPKPKKVEFRHFRESSKLETKFRHPPRFQVRKIASTIETSDFQSLLSDAFSDADANFNF